MLALIQRVSTAKVIVDDELIVSIKQGILVFIGIEQGDNQADARRLYQRLVGYRLFSDDQQKMNLSVSDIKGAILLIPQFTLAADTSKGMRPSFSRAAPAEVSQKLFEYLYNYAKEQFSMVEQGRFAANMQIYLCNDGPVTFLLQVSHK